LELAAPAEPAPMELVTGACEAPTAVDSAPPAQSNAEGSTDANLEADAAGIATVEGGAAVEDGAAVEGGAAVEDGAAADGAAAADESGSGDGTTGGADDRAPRKLTALRDDALATTAAEGFTSLVVAIRDAPAVGILALLARLVPGSPFVIYHPSITPLAECLHVCQQSRAAVRLQLLETWARAYQVAPNRTHPEMNAYPATGYVLCGVSVLRD